jgi:hypothetical protein
MEWSASKLTRIEKGEVRVDLTDLRALLDHFGVRDRRRGELESLARSSRTDSWAEFTKVYSSTWREFLGFESSANLVREYESQLVPGLLQTEQYVLAVCRSCGIDASVAERRWEGQLRRQKAHDRPRPPQMFFVLDESVLHRTVGRPDVMQEQLVHLKQVSSYRHVSLRAIPRSAGSYDGLGGPFVLLGFPDARDDDVCVEPRQGEVVLRVDGTTSADAERFATLESVAFSPARTVQLIDELMNVQPVA